MTVKVNPDLTIEEHFESWLSKLPPWLLKPNPEIYLSNNFTVIDFETSTLDFGDPKNPDNTILCASWYNGPDHPRPGVWTCRGSEVDMAELVEDIEAADFFVAHNTKFECGWLERCGLFLHKQLPFCTMLAEYVRMGNRKGPLSLDACLKKWKLGRKDPIGRLIRLGVDTYDIPPSWLQEYCTDDVHKETLLFLAQRKLLKERDLLRVTFSRNILTPVLVDMERTGMQLDHERVAIMHKKMESRVMKLGAEFAKMTGGVNVKSGPQMIKLLYGPASEGGLGFALPKQGKRPMLTKSGNPMTGGDAIDALVVKTKKQAAFLKLRNKLVKARDSMSKYFTKMMECCEEADGALTASFPQANTGTHRLSSKGAKYNVQMQNIWKPAKPVFKARHPGWSVGESDSEQLEFRTGVQLAQDRQGIADIDDGIDVHARTATIIFPDKLDPSLGPKEGANNDVRDSSKEETFRPMYGGRGQTKEQHKYSAWWREHYSDMYEHQMEWVQDCARTGQFCSVTGLIFYFPYTRPKPNSKEYVNQTNIFNYPVQHLATGELVPVSLVYIWHLMRIGGFESFLVNCIHDSVVGELHPEEIEIWRNLCDFVMSNHIKTYLRQVHGIDWTVPLGTETKTGTHWADSERWRQEWLT